MQCKQSTCHAGAAAPCSCHLDSKRRQGGFRVSAAFTCPATTGTDPSLVSRDMAPALWMAGAACHALLGGRPGRGLVLKQAPRDMCRVLGPGACQSQGQCQGAYMEDVYGVRVGRITSVSQGRCVCLSICAASFRHVIRVVLVAVLAHGLNMARRCHGARRLDVPPSLNVDGVPTHPGPASGCGWPRLCLSPSTVEGALGLPSSWKCQCPVDYWR